jgi:dynein heavy chain
VLERAFHHPSLDETVSSVYWEAMTWPSVITDIVAECEQRVKELTKKFKKELKADKETLSEDCHSARFEYNEFVRLGDIDAVEERLVRVEAIDAHHEALKERQELYAARQEIFGERGSRPKHLAELVKDFEPYANIWKTCADVTRTVPEWIEGPFASLDPEKVSGMVEVWDRSTKKNLKAVDGPPREVGEALLAKIQSFQELLPLVVALRNPGLKDRHWAKLSEDLGFAVNGKDPNFTLQKALKLDLVTHIETVEKVSESASKEYSLERTLDKMQKDWTGVVFDRKAWRDTGSFVLNATDEIQILLDDQVVKAMAMKASPYIGPFEDRARQWEKTLLTIQEVLDSWLKCQNGWLYLEPIFGSDDIMQQMPTEGRKFKTVDVQYRKMMEKLKITADVVVVGADEELLNQLQQSNVLLDDVNKGLSEYLETKRLAFPRFYFLSNDELLEILSETKDPLRVQPFLKKVFEAIHALEFQEDLEATAMISEEGEKIEFKNSFNPNTAGGQVEKWLTECEAAQRETVAEVCLHSSEAYAQSPRTEWMIQWPGQVVLCIGSLYWTSETEEALRTGTMPEYAEKCTAQLMDIVELVRGQLTKLQRKTLSALVVIEVHARDVVAQLAKQGVASPDDFEWASQLRYTWDEKEETGEPGVMVRMINAAVWYGNEYLGNSSRLVITPLTDRCYRTLMGAVHLDVGGAPEGPAGTGKTETTKDLAKAIAMQCVVFNCSDGLDYLAMAKFFKGLAASGAWACFDEFNRIDLEVLSVIAQQILTITRAKAAKLEVFDFEGTRLPLRRTCNVFITMNPGYAGRSELPDNLKALFRTVAMMVPDYAMIGEIILYSFGYLEARDMARKLVATYKLCSEQLSSQSHYDYGMRAVISVLRAAGAVKLKFPDEDESVLMLISLKDVNLPKFLAPDIPLFNNILSDLFPGVVLPEPDYDHMRASVMKECVKANLQPTPVFMEKLFQLYEMILVRHGLMLVGYSYGAKTSMYQMLAGALNDLKAQDLLDENRVKIVVINPKSIYMGQLYGQFDPVSHEWQDGVLAKKFRECAVDTSPDRKWVMFDGPVDAIWIENMNTVLDDNKKLCLMSGEIIQMSGTMNMIFEVQDLAVASPATVSRCGMIYVEPSSMGWEPLKDSWMNTLPPLMTPHKPRLEELFTWLVKPCMAFVRKNCKELIPTSDINLPFALMNIFDSMIDEFRVELDEGVDFDEDVMTPKDQKIFVDCVFLFSTVWSIGGTTENEGREKFDFFLRKLVDGKVDPSPDRTDFDLGPGLEITPPTEKRVAKAFPKATEGSVYDLHFEKDKFRWTNWLKTVKDEPIREELEFQNIVVTTIDTIRYRYIFDVLATHGKHVLFGGPTGTGKTVYIKQSLDAMDKDKWTNIQSTFSAQTNANQIQDIIDNKLDKRKKGVFGPKQGTRAVVFIDDLNMPMLEEYGAQPPIEIIRQWLDHGGWYDREELTMRKLVDIQFCAAMGPPGGGRNPVTPRMLRHFNQISICDFDDDSLRRVYTAITDWWCRRASVPKDVGLKLPGKLVEATLEIYNTIKRELLPTPMKSHYTYNMRDISKVWQGVSMIGEAPQNQLELIRLWSHETLRVFHDRLVNDEDRMWFFDFLKQMVDRHTGQKFDKVFAAWDFDKNGTVDIVELRRLMFANFMDGAGAEGKYAEVKDVDAMQKLVEEQLVEYNQSGKMRMDLVLFLYAAEHICRISRVIRQNLGNALLVGVGGSGRQSLTRIAAFMAEYEVYSIEITKSYTQVEWRDDLKNVLRKAGGEGSPTVFLFNDTQIKMESFLEDINNILNTGEVPNMFAKDETRR